MNPMQCSMLFNGVQHNTPDPRFRTVLVMNNEGVIYFIQKLLLHNIFISVLFLSGSVSQSGNCIRLWGGETRKSSYSSDMFWIRRCSFKCYH